MHECFFFNSSCKWIGLGVKEFHFTYKPHLQKGYCTSQILKPFVMHQAAASYALAVISIFVASLFHHKEKKNLVAH